MISKKRGQLKRGTPLHQSTAASTWWCGPRPRLGWVEMAVGLPEGPSYSRLFSDWRRTVSSKYFDIQVPSISTEELVLPRHARCVLSRLRCNGHSLLLSSYLSRIGRIENPSCSACGHSSQDTFHLILHCPATDSLRRSLFGDSLSLYDLWSRPWGVARLLGLHGLPPCLHPSEGVGKPATTRTPRLRNLFLLSPLKVVSVYADGKNIEPGNFQGSEPEEVAALRSSLRVKLVF